MGKHYVPQEYLRGFSSSASRQLVWMFDKVSKTWAEPAIKKVAQEADYYTPEIEKQLAENVESAGHYALNRLRSGVALSVSERNDFAYYLAVFLMRVPRRRRKTQELIPVVGTKTIDNVRNDIAELRTEQNSDRISHLLDRVAEFERTFPAELSPTLIAQVRNPWPSPQVIAAIAGMTWRIAAIPRDMFLLTSDNPAFFFDSDGLGRDSAELTFAIGSGMALLGSHQGAASSTLHIVGNALLVKEINRRIASGAERFIFASRQARWIETLALRKDPFLSRIAW